MEPCGLTLCVLSLQFPPNAAVDLQILIYTRQEYGLSLKTMLTLPGARQ